MKHIPKEKMDMLIKRKNVMKKIIDEGRLAELEQYNPYLPEANKDRELAYYYLTRDIIFELMEIREAKGLSQADLAKKMGTKQTAISRFENYNGEPTLEFMFKYAWALEAELRISANSEYSITLSEADYKRIALLAERNGIDIKQYASRAILNEMHNGEEYHDFGINLKSEAPPSNLTYKYERQDETRVILEVSS